ncbi:MAG: DUF814 domain-containing protein [Rhodothermales bacterium]|nr:DUF814 domain-containing protein [Rhodothermales bacterium]
MLRTYYTYRALSAEWDEALRGDSVAAIYSTRKNEVSIELASGAALVFGSRGAFRYLFRSDRSGRPRRNVTGLMNDGVGARLSAVRVATRDRVLSIDLADGREIRFMLFGGRSNMLLVREGLVVDAFKDAVRLRGKTAPDSRPAALVDSADRFLGLARASKTPIKAVTSGFKLFDAVLAREALHRSGISKDCTVEEALESGGHLYEVAREIESQVETASSGRIYRHEDGTIVFSLIELSYLEGHEFELFDDVDSAVRVCSRMMLREMRFSKEIGPIRKAVGDRLQKSERRLKEVRSHLARPSRADDLERYGHLLMASGRGQEQGITKLEMPDVFTEGETVSIPLDESLSVMTNAQRYYERARSSRESRRVARERLDRASDDLEKLRRTAAALALVTDMDGLGEFRKKHADVISSRGSAAAKSHVPFRRHALAGGFEVYVGRNARENDELTFGFARKFDIWMHARGVGGSHVVLRLPGRESKPGTNVMEAAASIAAYYSKARGSELVPVMYTERKYVRKVRGGDAGKVIVEREQVVIVPPALPST